MPLPAHPTDADFLRAFGERVRAERARRGMSRKLLAQHAGISERYISQLESGRGNVSLLILRRVAAALGLPMDRFLDPADAPPEMTLLRDLLSRLDQEEMRRAWALLAGEFAPEAGATRGDRIALIGLRGAGKTTIGTALAAELQVPFFELDREIEALSGTSLGAILELYGQPAYRRYEAEALRALLERHPRFVVATGGGIVSEPATYQMLLRHCFTVWIKATPEEHMARVIAQGDLRPMAGSDQAMDDLRRILAERTPLYARADLGLDTAGRSEAEVVQELLGRLSGRRPVTLGTEL